MYIYYKCAPDGFKLFLLSYVCGYVYWYTYEEIGKCFVDKPGYIFHVNFLGYTHWFIYIIISHLKDQYISVDQNGYDTSFIAKHSDNSTIKENSKLHRTNLPHGMILTKEDTSTSYGKVEFLCIQYNIHYRAYMG